jgi:redox-regulated HSP33 family molecular chaperone
MKTSSLALAAVVVAGAFAAPALASDNSRFDGDWYVTQLKHKGVNAVEVYEGSPGEVRAVVQLADGQQVFQYFDDETLAPVGINAAPKARVLSKVDTGHKAPVSSQYSLLAPDTAHDN